MYENVVFTIFVRTFIVACIPQALYLWGGSASSLKIDATGALYKCPESLRNLYCFILCLDVSVFKNTLDAGAWQTLSMCNVTLSEDLYFLKMGSVEPVFKNRQMASWLDIELTHLIETHKSLSLTPCQAKTHKLYTQNPKRPATACLLEMPQSLSTDACAAKRLA